MQKNVCFLMGTLFDYWAKSWYNLREDSPVQTRRLW